MFDHIGLLVVDLKKSLRFYQAALGPLGHVVGGNDDSYAGLGPKDAVALWLYKADKATRAHVAFRATSREAVDRFYHAGLEAGGKDNGKPGIRAGYSPNYYAAFLFDPDGNNVEAVYLGG